MKQARTTASLALAILLAPMVGCGGNGFPDPTPVTGTVNYNGSPIEGALVTFIPEGEVGRASSGTTDAQGTFSLTTFSTNDGAIPGKYKVTIAKAESTLSESEMNAEDPGDAYGEMMEAAASGTMDKLMKNELPTKYGKADTSGLTREVIEGQENNFGFDLE